MTIRYSQDKLREKLRALPKSHKTIFAAACAERLLPFYSARSREEGEELESAMRLLWSDLANAPVPEPALRMMAERCEELIARDDEDQDAAVAVVYALRSKWEEGTEEAQWGGYTSV